MVDGSGSCCELILTSIVTIVQWLCSDTEGTSDSGGLFNWCLLALCVGGGGEGEGERGRGNFIRVAVHASCSFGGCGSVLFHGVKCVCKPIVTQCCLCV